MKNRTIKITYTKTYELKEEDILNKFQLSEKKINDEQLKVFAMVVSDDLMFEDMEKLSPKDFGKVEAEVV